MRVFGREFPRGSRVRAAKVLETFCAEAAVLLLVFPVLDEFIQHGMQGVTWRFSSVVLLVSLSFLSVALLIAVFVHEE